MIGADEKAFLGGIAMRLLYFLFLLAFVAAIVIFVVQNSQEMTLQFLNWSATLKVALVVAGAFLLGMFSGWSIVGLVRRSIQRVREPDRHYASR
jgi:putative membrane protein